MRRSCALVSRLLWILFVFSLPGRGNAQMGTIHKPCSEDNGDCEHFCNTDNRGKPYCYCRPDYSLLVDNLSCSADCISAMNCEPDMKYPGKECPPGLKYTNGECQDINECEVTNKCKEICRNVYATYYCECKETGYKIHYDGYTCEDINECESENDLKTLCDHKCTNTPGSYHCSCKPGYLLYNGIHCTPRNKCHVNNGGCSHVCVYDAVKLKRKCECPSNYILHIDGKQCILDRSRDTMRQCKDFTLDSSLFNMRYLPEQGGDSERIIRVNCKNPKKAEAKMVNEYRCSSKTGYKWQLVGSRRKLLCTAKYTNPLFMRKVQFLLFTKVCYSLNKYIPSTRKRIQRVLKRSNKEFGYRVKKLQIVCVTKRKKFKKYRKTGRKMLLLKFTLEIRPKDVKGLCDDKDDSCIRSWNRNSWKKSFGKFQEKLKSGTMRLRIGNWNGRVLGKNPYLKKGIMKRNCPRGYVITKSICLICPAGTYAKRSKCLPCRVGTFQPKAGRTKCHKCKSLENALVYKKMAGDLKWRTHPVVGATNKNQCKDYCSPGWFSTDGLLPCRQCPSGSYQRYAASTRCQLCPSDYGYTRTKGSTGIGQCQNPSNGAGIVVCSAGSYHHGNACKQCSVDSYQPEVGQTSCVKCPLQMKTDTRGAVRRSQCKETKFYIDGRQHYGEIRSPNWPLAYPDNVRLFHRIKSNMKARKFLIFFDSLSFPQRENCNQTSLKLKYKGGVRKFCKRENHPLVVKMNASQMTFTFLSNSNPGNHTGFRAFYVSYLRHYDDLVTSIITDRRLLTTHKSVIQDRNLLHSLVLLLQNPSGYYNLKDSIQGKFSLSFIAFIQEKVFRFLSN